MKLSLAVLLLLGVQAKRHKRNMYPETAAGRQWWELDDHTERIHGSEAADFISPHDPEVVDAPEDIHRVGNDHEPLHNAKLSPDGYYNGFHHKDYQGNYVQKHRRSRHHPHRRHYMQYEHENDTEDIPDGLDPIMVRLRDNQGGSKPQKAEHLQNLMDLQTSDSEKVQLTAQISMPHEDDTDDISVEMTPSNYDKHHSKQWNKAVDQKAVELENQIRIEENLKVAEEKARETAKRKAAEERARAEAQKRREEEEKKKQLEQHSSTGNGEPAKHEPNVDFAEIYSGITAESIAIQTGDEYEHHTPFWNSLVEKRTQQLAAAIQKDEDEPEHHKTIDLQDVYEGMAVQTGDDYEHHTPYWNSLVEKRTQQLAAAIQKDEDEPEHHKTVDLEDVYEGMALQTQYENHSNFWYQRVEEESLAFDKEMREQEMKEEEDKHRTSYIQHMGMRAVDSTKNPSINFSEMYGGMTDYVQLSDHENDSDDVVPELSEEVKVKVEKKEVKKAKVDFAGSEFEEFYDE